MPLLDINKFTKKIQIRMVFIILFVLPVKLLAATQSEALYISEYNHFYSKVIDTSTGDQWWSFDIQSGAGITASLTGHFNNGYVNISLYDDHGVELDRANNIENDATRSLSKQFENTGTYFLKVSGSAIGSYDLALYPSWYNIGVTDNNREFYSSFDTARYISNGSYTRVSLLNNAFPLDDYFRFTAQTGEVFSALVKGYFSSGSVDVFLYDIYGNELSRKSNLEDDGTRELLETIYKSGAYYLKVSGNARGHYELVINGIDKDIDQDSDGLMDSVEFHYATNLFNADTDADGINDFLELTNGNKPLAYKAYPDLPISSKATAQVLPYSNKIFNSNFDGTGENWWSFENDAEGVTVALTGHFHNKGFVDMYLYDNNGIELNKVNTIEDGNTRQLSENMESGTYYLKVTGAAIGNYDLAIYPDWGNQDESVTSREFSYSFNTSINLVSDNYIRSNLRNNNAPLDDYYHFFAETGDTMNIEAVGHFNHGAVNLFLYDANGLEIGRKSNLENGGTRALTKAISLSGVYYLKVSGNAVGNYDLLITSINGL